MYGSQQHAPLMGIDIPEGEYDTIGGFIMALLDRIPEEVGGDLYLINGAMTKLEDAGAFAKPKEREEPGIEQDSS